MAEPRTNNEIWIVALSIGSPVAFFLGMAVFVTHSRLVGGMLMGGPIVLFLVSIARTPKAQWKAMTQLIADTEQEREGRPVTGTLWRPVHRFRNLVSIIMVVAFVAVVAYSAYRWFA